MSTHEEDLTVAALAWARANGESNPTNVAYIQCTPDQATQILGHDAESGGGPVDLVVMDGHFAAQESRGRHLCLLFDHGTHRRLASGMQAQPYDLRPAGLPVTTLKA